MQEGWLLLILILAVACGWLLGRWQSRLKKTGQRLSDAYYRGLNYLLNEQPEQAMDMFVEALADDSGAIDTHLALGRLFRARGDLSKATITHQNLLARPGLPKSHQLTVQYELASDYMAAGLYDRAERLLNELLSETDIDIRKKSLQLLLDIYQREKEWEQAIKTAESLMALKVRGMSPVIAQYFCEIAKQSSGSGDDWVARHALKKALNHDPSCIRAYLLLADIDFSDGHYREAIKSLKVVKRNDTAFLAETMPLLQRCYQQLGQEKKFYEYLMECLYDGSLIPSGFNASQVMRKLTSDPVKLTTSVKGELDNLPSLNGLRYLIDLQMYDAQGDAIGCLQDLRGFVDKLIEGAPNYRCKQCGYHGHSLSWQCPSCRQWGTIRPSSAFE